MPVQTNIFRTNFTCILTRIRLELIRARISLGPCLQNTDGPKRRADEINDPGAPRQPYAFSGSIEWSGGFTRTFREKTRMRVYRLDSALRVSPSMRVTRIVPK